MWYATNGVCGPYRIQVLHGQLRNINSPCQVWYQRMVQNVRSFCVISQFLPTGNKDLEVQEVWLGGVPAGKCCNGTWMEPGVQLHGDRGGLSLQAEAASLGLNPHLSSKIIALDRVVLMGLFQSIYRSKWKTSSLKR